MKTKKLPEVKVGQRWRDCDVRYCGRRIRTVMDIDGDYAIMGVPGNPKLPRTRVAIRRMYPHSTGWRLVK